MLAHVKRPKTRTTGLVQNPNQIAENYPNIYIPLNDPWRQNSTDYAAGAAAVTTVRAHYNLADGAGDQTVDFTLNNTTASQWDQTFNGFVLPANNDVTEYGFNLLCAAANFDVFNKILNTTNSTGIGCLRIQYDSIPTANGRIAALTDSGGPTTEVWDWTLDTSQHIGWRGNTGSFAANQDLVVAEIAYMCWWWDRRTENRQLVCNQRKIIAGSPLIDNDGKGGTANWSSQEDFLPVASQTYMSFGGRTTGGSMNTFGRGSTFADVRIFNFGDNDQPDNLEGLMVQLSMSYGKHCPRII